MFWIFGSYNFSVTGTFAFSRGEDPDHFVIAVSLAEV